MLASDRPTDGDTPRHDLAHRRMYTARGIRVIRVVRDVGVQVAIAGMEDVAYPHSMPRADRLDLLQQVGELRARDDRILHGQMRRHAPHRAERFLPPLPESRAFGGIMRDPHAARAGASALHFHRARVLVESCGRAIHFYKEHGRRVARISRRIDARLHRLDRRLVHQLERGRKDSRGDDGRGRVGRGAHRGEIREQRDHALGIRRESHGHVGDHAETPLAPDEGAEEVVATRITTIEGHDFTIRQHDSRAQDMVERDAVLEAVRSARVLRDVPADRARGL